MSEIAEFGESGQVDASQSAFDPFTGFVLGMAVGDALGLPREGLSGRRAKRMFGGSPLDHSLVFGFGLVSDDTEHMRMTALAMCAEPHNAVRFGELLARKLRWWLIGLPAGVGLATAKGILRLWMGWTPGFSGVSSAGNGPAMRAGVLGLCLHRDGDQLAEFVRMSTRLTHVDPLAETGAMIVALAVREVVRAAGARISPGTILDLCRRQADDARWLEPLHQIEQSLEAGESATEFADRLGLRHGVSGYIVHTVTVVLFCWLRWPGDFRRPVEEIILLGGDADTTAAILGGLAGASAGAAAIPPEWIERLVEWPYSTVWLKENLGPELRRRFGTGCRTGGDATTWVPHPLPRAIGWLAVFGRNIAFLAIVMAHGFRRLCPPY